MTGRLSSGWTLEQVVTHDEFHKQFHYERQYTNQELCDLFGITRTYDMTRDDIVMQAIKTVTYYPNPEAKNHNEMFK